MRSSRSQAIPTTPHDGGDFSRHAKRTRLPPHYHLVVVSDDLTYGFVVQTSSGWLLPTMVRHPGLAPPSRASVVLRRMFENVELVHEARVIPHAAGDMSHRYLAAVVSGRVLSPDVTRVSAQALLSGKALLPVQRQALLEALTRMSEPSAPFDTYTQLREAQQWMEREIDGWLNARLVSVSVQRCTRFDFVAACNTSAGTVHLKCGPDRLPTELDLTTSLRPIQPDSFPITISSDDVNKRWLYIEPPGARIWHYSFTHPDVVTTIESLSAIQKKAVPLVSSYDTIDALALFHSASQMIEGALHANDTPGQGRAILECWRDQQEQSLALCHQLRCLPIPFSLTVPHLRSSIVLGRHLGMVDLSHAIWSYPFLSLWQFIREAEARLGSDCGLFSTARGIIAAQWADLVSPQVMKRGFGALPILGELFAFLLESKRLAVVERDIGHRIPSWYVSAQITSLTRNMLRAPDLSAESF